MSSFEESSRTGPICPRCGTENLSEAVFCKKCGKRLDGMSVCPNCGKLTPADGEFCIFCGANRNSLVEENRKVIVNAQSKVASASTAVVSSPESQKQNVEPVISPSHPRTGKAKKVLNLVSFITGCLTLLVSVVFSFLIGASVSATGTSVSLGEAYIYDYFSNDVYNAVFNGGDAGVYGAIGPVLGTVGVVAGLIGIVVVVILAIKAIVQCVSKKEWSGLTSYAVLAYFVFLSSAALFMLNASSGSSAAGVDMIYVLNGATIAGIVLGAIFLVTTIVLDAVNARVVGTLRSYIVHGCSTVVIGLVGVLVLAFVGFGLLTTSVSYQGVTSSTTYGLLSFSNLMYAMASQLFYAESAIWNEFVGNFVASLFLMILTFALSAAFLIFFILTMKDTLSRFGYRFSKNTVKFGLLSGAAAVLLGLVKLILPLCIAPYFFGSANVNLAAPIMLIVFGLLIVASVLVTQMLMKKTDSATAE